MFIHGSTVGRVAVVRDASGDMLVVSINGGRRLSCGSTTAELGLRCSIETVEAVDPCDPSVSECTLVPFTAG